VGSRPPVFAVVCNYRHPEDTLRLLASLRRSEHRGVVPVVVDNGSPRPALDRLRDGLEATVLLATGENLGFGAGVNVGIRYALDRGADLVWILNPDTVVRPDTLRRLVGTALRHPAAGVVGGMIVRGDDPECVWFNGGEIDWSRGGRTRHLDSRRRVAEVVGREVRTVDYVTGACMLVKRAVLEEVGLFPEEYFLYFEDTELCVRARRAGWRSVVDPRARLAHHQRSWTGAPGDAYVYYFLRSQILFGRRWAPDGTEALLADLEGVVRTWRRRVEAEDPARVARFDRLAREAIADGLAGRTGRRPDLDGGPEPSDA
jgi:GT2 family glycosyltransferase